MLIVNQLIGFGVGGDSSLSALSFFASATSNSSTINFPASIAAGDIIVLQDRGVQVSGGPAAAVTPSGFTVIVNSTLGTATRNMVSYKLATGSESGALTGMNGADANHKAMAVFRPDGPVASIIASTPSSEFTASNPAAQNVAASGVATPLVVIGCYAGQVGNTIDPRTMSPAKDGEVNPTSDLYLAYKIYNSSPANVSVDMDDEGNLNFLASFYLRAT